MIKHSSPWIGSAGVIAALVFQYTLSAAVPANSINPRTYQDGWLDANKNGRKDLFEDPKQPVE